MIEDEVRERFLREIAAQVPADRIAELHLFRPLRRGGTETGVAVIAVEQEDPTRGTAESAEVMVAEAEVALMADEPEVADDVTSDAGPYAPEPVRAGQPADEHLLVDETEPSSVAGDDVELHGEPVAHADLAADDADSEPGDDTVDGDDVPVAAADTPRGYADIAGDDDAAQLSADEFTIDGDASDRRLEGPDAGVEIPRATIDATTGSADVSLARPARVRHVRHTVFTARYRLTRKGPDRGKWEFEVVADADAPLGTVDMVVRGVQRRAGDDEEPERLTAEGVRAALDGQAWQRTT